MRAHWAQQGLGAPEVGPIDQEEGEWSFQRLHSMRLGPFRGFRNQVEFELNQQLTLVYGPNGSGKSSLCEALEYALLGAVDEAEAKRIQLPTYLRNIHEGRFVAPELQGSLTIPSYERGVARLLRYDRHP
ncbi:AAA family ATPase [Aeromonas veronii]|uniref:AAA family ATPase n=1 Tax=Aeromonas veronii TaxID=654 RepID=UPI0015E189E2|nr:ATP-binding protein [Aeromonas veronii]